MAARAGGARLVARRGGNGAPGRDQYLRATGGPVARPVAQTDAERRKKAVADFQQLQVSEG